MKFVIPLVVALGLTAVAAEVRPTPSPDSVAGQALRESIKPAASDLRWQEIPWLTDLGQAQAVARTEERPIFLWVTGDDPLERC